jgi:hypothetical protein
MKRSSMKRSSMKRSSKKRNFSKTSIKTNQKLWEKIVKKIKNGSKGGLPKQWSARKAQLAVKKYKESGGSYKGKKTKKNSLVKWTRQKWKTKSGKPSVVGPNATGERYLPERAIRRMSKKDYRRTTVSKRRSIKKGKQYSKQPKDISKKSKKYRKEYVKTRKKSKRKRKSRKRKRSLHQFGYYGETVTEKPNNYENTYNNYENIVEHH